MKTPLAVILLFLLAPLAAPAQSDDGSEPPPGPTRHSRMERADFEEARKFILEHSPRRAAFYDKFRHGLLGDEHLVMRYRALRELKTQDSPLYDIKVREIELEDKVFGLVSDYRQKSASASASADADALRSQLRDAVTDLLKTRLDEHEHRFVKAQQKLAEAQKALDAERAGLDAAVDQRVNALLEPKTPPTTAPSAQSAAPATDQPSPATAGPASPPAQ